MEKSKFFSYSWHIDEREMDRTVIRIYGLNAVNETVCVIVKNFRPYVYIELPNTQRWSESQALLVVRKIDTIMGQLKPYDVKLKYKKRLYYANQSKRGKRRIYPYLRCEFNHTEDIRKLGFKLRRPLMVAGVGTIQLKMHEHNANPILQLTSLQKLPTAGWIEFSGKRIEGDDMATHCNHEFNVKWNYMKEHKSDVVARPLLMGYDIEVNSSIPSAMPKAERPGDKIFQISCVFARQFSDENTYEKYLLTLGEPDQKYLGDEIEAVMYETEHDLLLGFTELIQEKQPQIIIGYNIFTFDIPYMIQRAVDSGCIYEFDRQGLDKYGHAKQRNIKWSSSAYKNQSFQFLDAEGRLFVDLLPLVKRDYKMSNYKLKTISSHFLKGQTKDPLTPKGIFKCYRLGMKGGRKGNRAMGIVGKYCSAQGTQVSGVHGTVAIEKLVKNRNQVLSWDKKKDHIVLSKQTNFFDNGIRDCVELKLLDGRTITCTPDHRIAVGNGQWVEAGKIPVGVQIKVGPILPETQLETGNMVFTRLLGYVLTDGHVGQDRCNMYVGNLLDAQNIVDDIEKICGLRPGINKNGNCWFITIPALLSSEIRSVTGITPGNRTVDDCGLPDMSTWDEYMIKEFLGGLFGGDGWCVSLTQKPDFSPVGLTQSRRTMSSVTVYMEKISKLLKQFKISSSVRITEREGLFIGSLTVSKTDNEKFMKQIGYRYCYHKTIRTSVSVMYYRYRKRVISGYKTLYDKTKQLVSQGLSAQKAYYQAVVGIEYPPKYGTVKTWIRKGFPTGRPDQASRDFPKADKFTEMVGASNIFGSERYHTYSMTKEQIHLPVFSLPLIDVVSVGKKQVYDIEVKDTHSLLANGIVIHNCVQDSLLVVKLFETLTTWVALCEMSKVTNVPIFQLYTQGQQLKVFSQVYKKCLVAGTPVSLTNGLSCPIEKIVNQPLWSWSNDGLTASNPTQLLDQGVKETVKIVFTDGKELVCTPDHKLMTSTSEWIEAQDLIPAGKYTGKTWVKNETSTKVVFGCSFPVDNCVYNSSWKLHTTLCNFVLSEKSLAFARVLGFILTDGSICYEEKKERYRCYVYLGTKIDAESFVCDVTLLTGKTPTIGDMDKPGNIKGSTFRVNLPLELAEAIGNLGGVSPGNKQRQEISFPTFILAEDCPMPIIREFLGGLFGGDGISPSIEHRRTKSRHGVPLRSRFSKIGFALTIHKKYSDSLRVFMKNVITCLQKFGIKGTLQGPYKVSYPDTMEVCELEQSIKYEISLKKDPIFSEQVGYRYCMYKTYRTLIASSYWRMLQNVKAQHIRIMERIDELHSDTFMSIVEARNKAFNEFKENEYPFNEYYTFPDINYVYRRRSRKGKFSFRSDKIMDANSFLEHTGTEKWFKTNDMTKSYCVSRYDTILPFYTMDVLAIVPNGKRQVYDITVDSTQSFLANGVVVHNCTHENTVVERDGYTPGENDHYVGATVFPPVPGVYDKVLPFDFSSLYPTTIIAYNISWDTLVPEGSDIPDKDCHVMEWEDHIGCLVEGSRVTIGEYSLPIETMVENRSILAYNKDRNGLSYYDQTQFFDQGVKQCVELVFEDGSSVSCTPDHRILSSEGVWIEAKDIEIGIDRVKVGYCPPVYDVKDQQVIIDEFSFSGEKLIKFYKILGLFISDGHARQGSTKIYTGHPLDRENVLRDLHSLGCETSTRKEFYGYGIGVLGRMGEIFRDLQGVLWRKKSTQYRTFPKLLEHASEGELCAFLSGLFGSDGRTFSFSEKSGAIGCISLSWTGCEENLTRIFTQLQTYLLVCGIQSTIARHGKETMLNIRTQDSCIFRDKIGFSYCIHKSMRLEAGCSYLQLRDKVWEQQKRIVARSREFKKNMTIEDAVTLAVRQESSGPIYNKYYASPSVSQMIELLRSRKKWLKPMFSTKNFPTPLEYFEQINASKLFDSYAVPLGDTVLPCIHKKVIFRRNIGLKHVYDLEVGTSHSFLADGIVVHNCVHDPKEIRKAQINKIIKGKEAELKELRRQRDLKKNKNRKEEFKVEIAEFIENMRPLREERSTLQKSKPKHKMCCPRKFRWLKAPMGVLPEILTHLLDTRKATKKLMKVAKAELGELKMSDPEYDVVKTKYEVLDKRQLALKVSANSAYGAMGVQRGYLPLMPGAMCTTYEGRNAVQLAADSIQKDHRGILIYGDTDSNYVSFPHLKTAQECWDYAEKVAKEVTKLFPPPMNLAFEEIVYWRFFIITKKRYMSIGCERDGVIAKNKDGSQKINKKGVLLQRRDNCNFIRNVYAKTIMEIFKQAERDDIIYMVIQEINNLCSHKYPISDFVITKSIGDIGNLEPYTATNDKGKPCYKVGDYTVKLLPDDEKKRDHQYKLKDCNTPKEYYLKCLPAQVQLGERMRKRGQLVAAGSRLEYVITTMGGHTAKQYVKVESAEYVMKHPHSIELDYMYYLKQLANPLDQVLDIMYNKEDGHKYKYQRNFVLQQYKYRLRVRTKVLNELKKLFTPKLKFVEE